MNYLFDFGEALLCCLPLFFIIAIAGGSLLVNSMPSKKPKVVREEDADTRDKG
ncbi:MAG: hypothetical protein ABIV21_02310 [Pyrinomonadaceae bacterium]